MSEAAETSILKLALPTPLLLFSQLVTDPSVERPLRGLERSDFVPWDIASVPSSAQPRLFAPNKAAMKTRRLSATVVSVSGTANDGLPLQPVTDSTPESHQGDSTLFLPGLKPDPSSGLLG